MTKGKSTKKIRGNSNGSDNGNAKGKSKSKINAVAEGVAEGFVDGKRNDPQAYVGTNRIRIEPVTELRRKGSVGYRVVKTLLRQYGVLEDAPDGETSDGDDEDEEEEERGGKGSEPGNHHPRKASGTSPDIAITAAAIIEKSSSVPSKILAGTAPWAITTTKDEHTRQQQQQPINSASDTSSEAIPVGVAHTPLGGISKYSLPVAHDFNQGSNPNPGRIVTLRPIVLDVLEGAIPTCLSHLHPDTPINIVDRQSGRFLRGKEAILLKDLSVTLREHASYEPIIPSLPGQLQPGIGQSGFVQEARSAPKTRISGTVIPQPKLPGTFQKGDFVVIKSGKNVGLVGTFERELTGGWVLVKEYSHKQRQAMVRPIDLAHYSSKSDRIPKARHSLKRRDCPTLEEVENAFIGSVNAFFDDQHTELSQSVDAMKGKLERRKRETAIASTNNSRDYDASVQKIEQQIARSQQDMREVKRFKKSVTTYSGVVFRTKDEGSEGPEER